MYIARCVRFSFMLAVALVGMTGVAAQAADIVSVSNSWVRATVPGQSVAAAYMDLTAQASATLVGAETPAARKVELHMMSMDGGVMKMRQVVRIAVPINQTVSLQPAGYHLMLIDIKRELKAGERVPLELILRDRQGVRSTVKVEAEVRAVSDGAMQHK